MGRKGGIRIKQVGPKAPKMFNPMEDLAIPPEEMINMPPPPDRSFQLFWPIHETFTMDPTGFIIIYPSYLDSSKTVSQGRRIGQEKAVDTPTVNDISQALQTLNIRHVLQPNKGYSRDIETLWDNPGRVKVDPGRSQFENKKELLVKLATIIRTLPARIQRLEQEKQQALLEEKKAEEEAERLRQAQKQQQQHQQQKAAASKTTNKKKGKKKR
eukprot:Nitzschia sp. Nitz4//scaffold5_size260463//18311//19042//NITZ4_000938-RA/size260463-augustus-gene-0.25-mRNA-1//-1//CDS//3329555208//1478//frame0